MSTVQEKPASTEAAILNRILEPEKATLSVEAARIILTLDFNEADKMRMRELAALASDGRLNTEEQIEANNYERVGHFLNVLQSKARRSIKNSETR